jgi:uncharacterized protein
VGRFAGLLVALLLGLDAVPAAAQSSGAPSFDCAKAAGVETAVCADPSLAMRDRMLATLYAVAKAGALGDGRSGELAAQRLWLKGRDACGQDRACLAQNYDARLRNLAIAALFRTPDVALSELRREDPETAADYEAMWRYASTADPLARQAIVTPLISATFGKLRGQGRVIDILDAKSPQQAAASDKAFAAFLDLLPVAADDSTILPCALFVQRRALIDALDPMFGSTMDTHLAGSDCDETLAPAPELKTLAAAALKAAPLCEGTICFFCWREDAKGLIAIRLNRPDIWRPTGPNHATRAEDRFRASHASQMAAAAAELAPSYVTGFKLGRDAARRLADEAVSGLVRSSLQGCQED